MTSPHAKTKALLLLADETLEKQKLYFSRCALPRTKTRVSLKYFVSYCSFNGFTNTFIALIQNWKVNLSSKLKETCDAIYETLDPDYLRPPSSVEDWMKIAKDF